MSQEEFGAAFSLGTQGMVWQYLNGYTPLNIEAAAKFARGLRCTIRDISPQMADELEGLILPVLGRKLGRRVAMLALLTLAQFYQPAPAEARFNNNFALCVAEYTLTAFRRWLMWLAWRGSRARKVLAPNAT
jgi:hypothetical protein